MHYKTFLTCVCVFIADVLIIEDYRLLPILQGK